MAGKTEPYVDTSALIAFVDRSDSHNALFTRLFSDPPQLITSTLVVSEAHAWFLRRYDRQRALTLLSLVDALKPLRVLPVGSTDLAAARKVLLRFQDQNLTITDAVGLSLMTRQQTAVCWSTDRHLGLTGVPLVIHLH